MEPRQLPRAFHLWRTLPDLQYVMSGTATVWLGNAPREVRAGDLVTIPRGVVHGTLTTSTEFKSMAIKLPPQRAGDTRKVP